MVKMLFQNIPFCSHSLSAFQAFLPFSLSFQCPLSSLFHCFLISELTELDNFLPSKLPKLSQFLAPSKLSKLHSFLPLELPKLS